MRTEPYVLGAKTSTAVQIGAVALGNVLESYDFLIFSFFAIQIGKAFFPETDDNSSLLFSLATFGVGFLMRPLGGLVIGRLGDAWGRRPAMLLSFGLMGASIVGMALTPSYASIGFAAPLLRCSSAWRRVSLLVVKPDRR